VWLAAQLAWPAPVSSDSFAAFAVRRLLAAVLVVVIVTSLTFVLVRVLTPENFAGERAMPVELAAYLERVFLHWDFGESTQRPFGPVATMLGAGLGADVALFVGSVVVGLTLGVAGGVVCALRPRTVVARCLEFCAAILVCTPVYVVAMVAILLFSPAVGAPVPIFLVSPNSYVAFADDPARWLRALSTPWLVAGLPLAAMTLRMVRATFPEVLAEDYVRTAAGKGLAPRRIALRHALPVAVPPALSLAGAYAPMLIANVILVEAVFGIPGLYRLIPSALDQANFPVLQAMVVVGTVIVVVSNALVDVVLAALDPRVTMGSGARP
jgi:peptide/nickel transport system permease protein